MADPRRRRPPPPRRGPATGAYRAETDADPLEAPPSLRDLFHADPRRLDATVDRAPTLLEPGLRRLALRRGRAWDMHQQQRLARVLVRAYLRSGDVRFHNEALWHLSEGSALATSRSAFAGWTRGLHPHPLATPAEADRHAASQVAAGPPDGPERRLKVGLLGLPALFRRLVPRLARHEVHALLVPSHPERARHLLLRSRIGPWLLHRLLRCRYPYRTLSAPPNSEAMRRALAAERFDVGFHKLGSILRPTVFEPFAIGLLNDHWGLLPLLRGRSTPGWAALHGFPQVATVHFVDAGVDTGAIVKAELLRPGSAPVSALFRRDAPRRVAEAMERLAREPNFKLKNESEAGLQYYGMHPEVENALERVQEARVPRGRQRRQ